nr:unnamed protein product [Digitaria exilis]
MHSLACHTRDAFPLSHLVQHDTVDDTIGGVAIHRWAARCTARIAPRLYRAAARRTRGRAHKCPRENSHANHQFSTVRKPTSGHSPDSSSPPRSLATSRAPWPRHRRRRSPPSSSFPSSSSSEPRPSPAAAAAWRTRATRPAARAPARWTPATGERGGAGGGRRIIDITHAYVADLPVFATGEVAGPVVRLKQSMAEGSEYNLSELKLECHTGTHVDAPGHINQDNFAAGLDVDTLDLEVLNGSMNTVVGIEICSAFLTAHLSPDHVSMSMSMANGSSATCRSSAWSCTRGHMIQEHFEAGLDADTLDLVVLIGPALLVDVPRDTNITAQAMEYLNIPKGVRRVLFRTLNTDRKLMWKKGGDFSYVGFTEDGAQRLVDNTDIKLIGVDYLSVAAYDHLISAHVVFFKNPSERVPPGGYPWHAAAQSSVAAAAHILAYLSCELATMVAPPLLLMLLAVAVTLAPRALVAGGGAGDDSCGLASAGAEVALEEHGGGRIIDITHAYRPDLPAPGRDGLGPVTRLTESMANGSVNNVSELKMVVHSGTHVDAPGHMVQEHFVAGLDVDKLDLDVLNGPALLIDVPRDTNITAQAMESLNIPRGVRRVLFRTLNTDRKLMWTKEIDTSFVGFTEDGAQWLLDNTDIKLVGVKVVNNRMDCAI